MRTEGPPATNAMNVGYVHVLVALSINSNIVTRYSKTDHNVTFGQFLFIGPANSHTHTLPMHCMLH